MTLSQVSARVRDPESVDVAIQSRFSARAFRPDPVPRATLEHILEVASRAPSGTNTQPWQVHVLTGDALKRLSDRIMAVYNDPAAENALTVPPAQAPLVARRLKNAHIVLWPMLGHLAHEESPAQCAALADEVISC